MKVCKRAVDLRMERLVRGAFTRQRDLQMLNVNHKTKQPDISPSRKESGCVGLQGADPPSLVPLRPSYTLALHREHAIPDFFLSPGKRAEASADGGGERGRPGRRRADGAHVGCSGR